MPTSFPGMDPYLERRGMWEDVHTRLIVAIAEALTPHVRPTYRVAVEQRTYLSVMSPDDLIGQPDVLLLATREPRVAYDTRVAPLQAGAYVGELPQVEEVKERYLEIRSATDGEVEPILPLNQVLHDLYDRAGYDLAIDYSQPAEPPLDEADAKWAGQLVSQRAGESLQ